MPEEQQVEHGYIQVSLTNFLGGFAPLWYEDDYSRFGNRNMASNMESVDITSPGFLTQGKDIKYQGISDFPIDSFLDRVVGDDKSFAICKDHLYNINSEGGVNVVSTFNGDNGLDIDEYQGFVYYSYEDNEDVYVGRYNIEEESADDTWKGPFGGKYGILEAGGGALYISAGSFVSRYIKEIDVDGNIVEEDFNASALRLPYNSEIVSMKWHQNRLWIATNNPNKPGKNEASIFIWDGWSVSFSDQIKLSGKIGGLFLNNGVIYCTYEENADHNVIGIIDGQSVRPLTRFDGELPDHNKITNYKNHVLFLSGDRVFLFGSPHQQVDSALSEIASSELIKSVGNPFGKPFLGRLEPVMIDGSPFNIGVLDGISSGYWQSLMITTSAHDRLFQNQVITVYHNDLSEGGSFILRVRDGDGSIAYEKTIDKTVTDSVITILNVNAKTRETLIEIEFADPEHQVKIRGIYLRGKTDR